MASKKEIRVRKARLTARLNFFRKKHEHIKQYYLHPKTCPFCGAPIFYERRHKTFCGRSCAMSAIKTGRPREWTFTCCLFCYKDLVGPHRLKVRYCSSICYQADKWRKRVEEMESTGRANDPRTAKKYLLQSRGHQCEQCRRKTLRGQAIGLDIHHLNGHPLDHRLNNLQLLCHYCHAMTDNYTGKKHRLKRR